MKKMMVFYNKSSAVTEKELNKEALDDLLYSQLCEIYEQIRKEGKIEIFGDRDFDIVEKIDNKKQNAPQILLKKRAHLNFPIFQTRNLAVPLPSLI